MDEKKAKSHVSVVAILHIAFGALGILGAVITFVSIAFAGNFVPEHEDVAKNVLATLMIVIPSFIGFFGLIGVLAGASLYSYKQGARIFVIVVSAFNCLSIPIGTAKGVYSIWVLMQPEVQELFE